MNEKFGGEHVAFSNLSGKQDLCYGSCKSGRSDLIRIGNDHCFHNGTDIKICFCFFKFKVEHLIADLRKTDGFTRVL